MPKIINKEKTTPQNLINFEKYYDVKSAAELGILAQAIADCVISAFQGGVTEDDIMNHMSGDIVMVSRENNSSKVNAFSATVFNSPNVIFGTEDISNQGGAYFAAATVREEAQGKGLYKNMNAERISEVLSLEIPLIFTRTQNPRVQAGIEAVLNNSVDNKEIKSYRVGRKKIPKAYGQMLTKTRPFSDSVSFEELDLEAGDAYILLFHITY